MVASLSYSIKCTSFILELYEQLLNGSYVEEGHKSEHLRLPLPVTFKVICFVSFFTVLVISALRTHRRPNNSNIYNAITQNNCFVKGFHKYDVYLVDENKAHLN